MRRMNTQTAIWRRVLCACAIIIAWSAGLGQGSVAAQESVMVRDPIVNPKTSEIPLAGISTIPAQEADKLMEGKSPDELMTCVERLDSENLYKDAVVVLKRVVDVGWINDDSFAAQVKRAPNPEDTYSRAMRRLVNDYMRSNDFASVDALLEEQAKLRATSWRTLTLVADLYAQTPRELYRVSGNLQFEFVDGAEVVSRAERLRTRRLQLYNEARKLARDYSGASRNIDALITSLYNGFVATLKENRPNFFKYELLTDLTTLPEVEPISYSAPPFGQGVPVDENGDPIFYHAPKSFEEAANDGERIQALYNELCEVVPSQRAAVLKTRAYDARAFYGVTTLASYNVWRNLDDEQKRAAALASLEELADNETVARLANGVRSFTLPEDYAYIDLFREARDEIEKTGNFDDSIYLALAQEFEMRGQLERAADVLRDEIDTLKRRAERLKLDSYAPEIMKRAQAYLSQIVDPRAAFDDSSQVLGEKAKLVLRSRNSKSVKVVVRRLDVDAIFDRLLTEESDKWLDYSVDGLLDEFIHALSLGKPQNDREKRLIADVDPPKKFIGKEVASLNVAVENAPGHKDTLTEFEIPNLAPGAYLVEALSKNGKEETKDSAVIWTRSATMARRLQKVEDGSDSATLYFMDTVNGKPLSNTKLEITSLGWNGKDNRVVRCVYDKTTDEKGAVDVEFFENDSRRSLRLTVVKKVDAKGNKELCAFSNYLSFSRLLPERATFEEKGLVITDRPIYRPKQRANFKTWIGYARYDKDGFDNFCADETVAYIIYSPTGEIVAKKTGVKLDQYGGFSDFFEIPESAQLGSYRICVGSEFNEDDVFDDNDDTPALRQTYASGYFRLEEYRKPEFKVSVEAPTEPVALGDKFKATIRAEYYFGAPVANGKVKYTVARSTLDARWSPPRYWDWFYGPGYWRMSYDAAWYPGWERWGDCVVSPRRLGVSEVVLSGEGELNEEGVLELEIDSSMAKKLYPTENQSYSIHAEVVDDSRRVVSGTGAVKAARKPFSVVAWFDKGFYRQGETMNASFQTRRVDGKPVLGKVVVKLYAIAYDGVDEEGIAKATETEVFREETSANENGAGSLKIAAPKPGQYRLSCAVTTDEGLSEEGGRLIVVSGSDSAAVGEVGSCRFNALEIISDKPEYAPGDTARIQISSSKPDASVYFFTRFGMDAESSVPQLITLQNGVAYVDVKIEERDQPNFYVDAMTVFEGRFYQETRQICVPPVKRVLDVEVTPAQERVKPGEKLKIKLRLTDPNGEPVVGQTVATVYDASLEAISGGPNVGDIRKYFWDWKRHSRGGFESTILSSVYSNVFSSRSPRVSYDERLRILGNLYDYSGHVMGGGGRYLGVIKSYGMSAVRRDEIAVEEDGVVALDSESMAMAAPMMAKAGAATNFSLMMANRADMDDGASLEAQEIGEVSAAPAPTEELAEAVVRTNLADLAYWAADLTPDDDGAIEIEIDVPENLTTWNVYAWTVAPGLRVGSGKSSFITTKDVIVRMEKPRFLTRGDEAVLSAVVHNYSDSDKSATVSLSFPEGEGKEGALELLDPQEVKVDVPVNGAQRVDWRVKATKTGEINLLMKALATGESDAIQESLTINEHGIDKQIAFSGMRTRKPDEDENFVREITTTIDVPAERREDSASLTLRYSPTLAGAILDAIPYLSDYPYGCVEQTLNRFLPAAIARKTLGDLGLDLETIGAKRANLNAQELGDAAARARQWKRSTKKDAVFDSEEMDRMVKAGVDSLTSRQNSDGGWGWFAGCDSSAHITALVTRGLYLAKKCDCKVNDASVERAAEWLLNYERVQVNKILRGRVLTEEEKKDPTKWDTWKPAADNVDAFVYCAFVECGCLPSAFDGAFVDDKEGKLTESGATLEGTLAVMKELLWDARQNLSLLTLASYAEALALEESVDENAALRIETVLRVLAQSRKADDENQTLWLDLSSDGDWLWWRWYESEFETQAAYLRLLCVVDPQILDKVGIAQDAPRLIKYLLNNRKHATRWNSTRDTATCVEAFAEYLAKTKELKTRQRVEVFMDGEKIDELIYTPENLFETDGTVVIPADKLTTGAHSVSWRIEGDGASYANSYFEFFTLEDQITSAGLEVKAERRYFKLVEDENAEAIVAGGRGQALRQRVERYRREPLNAGDEVKSGDLIEVEILIDSKNDYESIMIRDPKPAGFETVDSRSGYRYDMGLSSYVEFRDAAVCFFVENLAQGRSRATYRMRAETPGSFSALPTTIEGMYAPELKGNSDEFKTKVVD